MIGFDTNVLIRVFVDDSRSPGQVAAARRLAASSNEKIRISIVVLVEAIWTLRRHFGVKRAGLIRFLQDVLDHPRFDVESRGAVEDAFEEYVGWKLDFADSLIKALNITAGVRTTFTFDQTATALTHFTLLETEA